MIPRFRNFHSDFIAVSALFHFICFGVDVKRGIASRGQTPRSVAINDDNLTRDSESGLIESGLKARCFESKHSLELDLHHRPRVRSASPHAEI